VLKKLLAEDKGVIVRLGLKEVGSKLPNRRTETTYQARIVDEFAKSDEIHTTTVRVNVAVTWKESHYS
jgi:hypothetical protein